MFTKLSRRLLLSPSPQLKIVLIGEDYGLKVSIKKNKSRANLTLPSLSEFNKFIPDSCNTRYLSLDTIFLGGITGT